jgi:predicted metalloprotease
MFFEFHSSREGLNLRGALSNSNRDAGESNFNSSSFGVGDSEATNRREQKHEAMAAVRLVLRDGEVIWSTTQESSGAKYRGPASDVAEKVTQQLVGDVESARKGAAQN